MTKAESIWNKKVSYSFVGEAKDLLDDIEQLFTAYYDELTEDYAD